MGSSSMTIKDTALLIIDVQESFRDIASSTIIANITTLAKKLAPTAHIILTQHGHTPRDFKPESTNQIAKRWGDGSIKTFAPEWDLIEDIDNLVDDALAVVAKDTYNAFENTELEGLLSKCGIRKLIICGVMTDLCVETTARVAFCKGYDTTIVSDATASKDAEHHERGLATFRWAFGKVCTTAEVLESLKKTAT